MRRLVLFFVVLCACSEDDPIAPSTIGREGGRVETENVALQIPAGAVDSPIRFRISALEDPGEFTHPGDLVSAFYRFEPEGLQFARPVRVSFAAADGDDAAIVWSRPDAPNILDVVSTERVNGQLVASVTHFSVGGVVVLAGSAPDAGSRDAGPPDAEVKDADVSGVDAGPADGGTVDATVQDASAADVSVPDTGIDMDAGSLPDAATADAGFCNVSPASLTHRAVYSATGWTEICSSESNCNCNGSTGRETLLMTPAFGTRVDVSGNIFVASEAGRTVNGSSLDLTFGESVDCMSYSPFGSFGGGTASIDTRTGAMDYAFDCTSYRASSCPFLQAQVYTSTGTAQLTCNLGSTTCVDGSVVTCDFNGQVVSTTSCGAPCAPFSTGIPPDAGVPDSGFADAEVDAGRPDAMFVDAGPTDTGLGPVDGGTPLDASPVDASTPPDAGTTGAMIVQIEAGGDTETTAVSGSGALWAWGFGFSTTPTQVAGLSAVAQSASNGAHRCVRLSSGVLRCWGSNQNGQLGDGTTIARSAPTPVVGISSATDLAVGGSASCAVLSSGQIHCWGANAYGQLGDGTTTQRASPVRLQSNATFTQVTLGFWHACGLTSTGSVFCWGRNQYGQLGDGSTTDRSTAVQVSGLTSAVAISANASFTCAALSSGAVRCWGRNNAGQLGNGTSTDSTTPVAVSNLSSATYIATGYAFVCARLRAGAVQCWGNNATGELGDGTTISRATPANVSGISTAATVTADGYHACAVLSAGPVECWGANDLGQSGSGSSAFSHTTPVRVSLP